MSQEAWWPSEETGVAVLIGTVVTNEVATTA
jgi:hypothetical protein